MASGYVVWSRESRDLVGSASGALLFPNATDANAHIARLQKPESRQKWGTKSYDVVGPVMF
jgi:hypothetical protein